MDQGRVPEVDWLHYSRDLLRVHGFREGRVVSSLCADSNIRSIMKYPSTTKTYRNSQTLKHTSARN